MQHGIKVFLVAAVGLGLVGFWGCSDKSLEDYGFVRDMTERDLEIGVDDILAPGAGVGETLKVEGFVFVPARGRGRNGAGTCNAIIDLAPPGETGTPLQGVNMELWIGGEKVAETQTDVDGHFVFTGLSGNPGDPVTVEGTYTQDGTQCHVSKDLELKGDVTTSGGFGRICQDKLADIGLLEKIDELQSFHFQARNLPRAGETQVPTDRTATALCVYVLYPHADGLRVGRDDLNSLLTGNLPTEPVTLQGQQVYPLFRVEVRGHEVAPETVQFASIPQIRDPLLNWLRNEDSIQDTQGLCFLGLGAPDDALVQFYNVKIKCHIDLLADS